MNLRQLQHSSGALLTVLQSEGLYLCAREHCPHWQGQPALAGIPGALPDMYCTVVGYAPDTSCQAEYLDQAETMDTVRRELWQRLDDAEALEQRRHKAAAAARRAAD